jgi:hypothetical protein
MLWLCHHANAGESPLTAREVDPESQLDIECSPGHRPRRIIARRMIQIDQ